MILFEKKRRYILFLGITKYVIYFIVMNVVVLIFNFLIFQQLKMSARGHDWSDDNEKPAKMPRLTGPSSASAPLNNPLNTAHYIPLNTNHYTHHINNQNPAFRGYEQPQLLTLKNTAQVHQKQQQITAGPGRQPYSDYGGFGGGHMGQQMNGMYNGLNNGQNYSHIPLYPPTNPNSD